MRIARRRRAVMLLGGLMVLLTACGSSPSAQSTASPPAASATASPATSTTPQASNSSAPSSGAAKIVALGFEFRPKALKVKADQPFTIAFHNAADPGVIHDIDIRATDGVTVVVDQETIDGGHTVEYAYPKLAAGEYVFICSVHPIGGMTGVLTVE